MFTTHKIQNNNKNYYLVGVNKFQVNVWRCERRWSWAFEVLLVDFIACCAAQQISIEWYTTHTAQLIKDFYINEQHWHSSSRVSWVSLKSSLLLVMKLWFVIACTTIDNLFSSLSTRSTRITSTISSVERVKIFSGMSVDSKEPKSQSVSVRRECKKESLTKDL